MRRREKETAKSLAIQTIGKLHRLIELDEENAGYLFETGINLIELYGLKDKEYLRPIRLSEWREKRRLAK